MLTGATGFIGRHLCGRLSNRHMLHALVRSSSRLEQIHGARPYIFDGGISLLSAYLAENKIEGVIHLASDQTFTPSGNQIKSLILSNIWLGTALLEACKQASVGWFLNTGTIWQNYNAPDGSDEYNPVNLYAATKQAFIDIAKYYTETSFIRFCTLKLCDTYGPDDTRRKFLSLFEENAKGDAPLDMSPGNQEIDLIHVDDAVQGFARLAEMLSNPSEKILPEYVLSSGRRFTLREFAEMYERKNKITLNIKWGGRPYREREVMSPYKGNVLPGWRPIITEKDWSMKDFLGKRGGVNYKKIPLFSSIQFSEAA